MCTRCVCIHIYIYMYGKLFHTAGDERAMINASRAWTSCKFAKNAHPSLFRNTDSSCSLTELMTNARTHSARCATLKTITPDWGSRLVDAQS